MEYQNENTLNAEIKKSFAEYSKIMKDAMSWEYEDLDLEDAQHLVVRYCTGSKVLDI